MVTKAALRQILLDKWDYPERQVDASVDKLFALHPTIFSAFETWLDTKVIPDSPDFDGFNPKNLSETYPLKPPAVFMLLDWIRRDSQQAAQALYHEYHKFPARRKDRTNGS